MSIFHLKELANIITKHTSNISLKSKLFISYLIIGVLPLFLLFFAVYGVISSRLEEKALFSVGQSMDQAKTFLDYRTKYVSDIIDIASTNDIIQEVLSRDYSTYNDNIELQMSDYNNLSFYLSNLQKGEDINKIRVYMREGPIYLNEKFSIFSLSDISKTDWFERLMNSKEKNVFLPASVLNESTDNPPVIPMFRKIKNANNYNEIIGIMRADIPENKIMEILLNAKTTPMSQILITNSANEIICSTDYEANDIKENLQMILDAGKNKPDSRQIISIDNKRYVLASHEILLTDWTIIAIVPYSEILAETIGLRNQIIIFIILAILLTLAFSYFISFTIVKRIKRLIKHMRKVEDGNFDIDILPYSKDEIGELTGNFNYMLTKISMLIDEKYKLGMEMKNTELKALQAQINPHFLYNTLDLINWMSIENNVPRIGALVQSLARFYKLSLNKGEDIVPVRNEIEHIRIYVEIQNTRYDNRINLSVDLDKHILDLSILKLTIQPLVENSILHGILTKRGASGNIMIYGEITGEVLILRISDNGKGMTEEEIQRIFQDTVESHSLHGYAVKNINKRYKIYYGDQYGLAYKSVPGSGTIAEIRLPAMNIDS